LLLDVHLRATGPFDKALSSFKDLVAVAEAEVALFRVGEPFSLEEEPLRLEGGVAARATLGRNRHANGISLWNFMISSVVSFLC
jgi:hypothetical protein